MIEKLKMQEILQNSKYAMQMITNLINDLLDQAKIESCTFKFFNTYFNLLSLVRRAHKIMEPQGKKKNIQFNTRILNGSGDVL